MKSDAPKLPKKAKAKRDGVIKYKITISIKFISEPFDAI